MTKRNARNRRHGTNEMAAEAARKKARLSPTDAAENLEYTMIDLVRSVERLHFCKSGDRKDTVLWADVKKYHKKHTGRVLSTEAFNKLAGVNGVSRKELIAGPLAGLLVAEDPAALVIRFKYDANKGDPLINHRYFLEAAGAKTSVHNASEVISPPRLADLTNMVSPSRSETSSDASLSPTCLSSISTDPDTEAALSPISAASPSSTPISPNTCEYATAMDDEERVTSGGEADTSFLTARTSPMTSDWSSASSRADTESPQSRRVDQDKTFNLLDVSIGAATPSADRTMGPSELLVGMDSSPLKEDQPVKAVEEKKEEEEREEEGSDKENQTTEAPQQQQPVAVKPTPTEAASPAVPDALIVEEEDKKKEEEEVKEQPDVTAAAANDVIPVESVVAVEEEVQHEEKEAVTKAEDDVIEHQSPVEEEEKREEIESVPVAVAEQQTVTGEVKEEEEKEKEEGHDLAGGDCPIPVDQTPVVVDEQPQQPPLPSSVTTLLHDAVTSSSVTASSSNETLLTVIERPLATTVPDEEQEQEEEPLVVVQQQQQQSLPLSEEEKEKRGEMEEEEVKEEEEEVMVVEKVEELAAAAPADAPATVLEQPKEEEAVVAVTEAPAAAVEASDEGKKEGENEEKKEESRVEEEEIKQVPEVAQTVVIAVKEEEEKESRVETVEKSEPVPETVHLASEEEVSLSSTTEEPTATTMVAAVAPMQQSAAPAPSLVLPTTVPPPLPQSLSHEPMTSDDVDMNDVLAGGPHRDVHTPSVTAPITLQPKPTKDHSDDDTEVITHQPVVDELDSAPHVAAATPSKEDVTATSPDDLALRRAAPAKKFPCCTIV